MSCEEVKLRLEKFLLCISATEFPPDDDQLTARKSRCGRQPFHIACFCGSAFDTLARGMYRRESGAHHVREGCSPMVREGFICHTERHLQVLPPGSGRDSDHRRSCRLEPFAASNAATAATTATCRIGRVCDSITRGGEGMGSLKCCVLLYSGRGFNTTVYQDHHHECWRAVAALRRHLKSRCSEQSHRS